MLLTAVTAARALLEPYLVWIRLGAVIVASLALAFAVVTVRKWHRDSIALKATEKALATSETSLQQCTASQTAAALAYAQAVRRAESVAAADRVTAERVERELQTNLAAADRSARDLAHRLRDYQARRCSGAVPAVAGTAAEPAARAQEPGDGEAVDAATAAHLAACAADAVDLAGWGDWWAGVQSGRSESFKTPH